VNIAVDMPIVDGPKWISHIELSRDEEGRLQFRIVKRSGEDYGSAIVEEAQLRKAMEIV
jgi:hypothetical protein